MLQVSMDDWDTSRCELGSSTKRGAAGVGLEKEVADPLNCTPPAKIRLQFRGSKHT
jgi:hypothetical protein